MRIYSIVIIYFFLAQQLTAQSRITVQQIKEPMAIDGQLNEFVWQQHAFENEPFSTNYPTDTGISKFPTQVHICFDEKYIYIAAKCTQDKASYVVQNLKRDFATSASDAINIIFDPSKDGLNGFIFGVNPYNVQREGLVYAGEQISLEWDNAWTSAVNNSDSLWIAEIAIPFSSLRYNQNENFKTWNIQIVRNIVKQAETSVLSPIPSQYNSMNLSFCGIMEWQASPPPNKRKITFIPYVKAAVIEKHFPFDTSSLKGPFHDLSANLGLDAKVAITSGLNLDISINPDFSQVEVDQQVTDLSRFELFFPETRQFFLENRDLFALFGFPDSRPFFSRRIGIAFDPVQKTNIEIPIQAGLRLSGKLTDDIRLGIMSMQTAEHSFSEDQKLPAANISVASLQHKIWSRSTLSGIFANKQNFTSKLSEDIKNNFSSYNRVAGLEFNLFTKNNHWSGEWFYHRSFSPLKQKQGGSMAHYLGYNVRKFSINTSYFRVEDNFDAEVGFVPRKGIDNGGLRFTYKIYPSSPFWSKYINQLQLLMNGNLTTSNTLERLEHSLFIGQEWFFQNQSRFYFGVNNRYTKLTTPFNPGNNTSATPLSIGDYTFTQWELAYNDSPSRYFQCSFASYGGEFYNGDIVQASVALSYRVQPLGKFSVQSSFTKIHLPSPYAQTSFWLVGPKAELAFSHKLFFSTFLQYNTQINNFNINSRLQWRFASLSDIFLVYTDNRFAEPITANDIKSFAPKNKTLVCKIVYWIK